MLINKSNNSYNSLAGSNNSMSRAPKPMKKNLSKKNKDLKRSTVNELAIANKSRELQVDNDINLM